MSDDPVLSVDGLETVFHTHAGTVRAVRGISFDLARGERMGIVGESGSGKSAMVLSILGLIEPPGEVLGGSVKVNGRELVGRPERELQRVRGKEISLIYQDPMSALDPVKTIGRQLVETIRQHDRSISRGAARKAAAELLRDVEVPQPERRLDDYPHQYSGGMRQRVMIASALANRPDVVIADEPTTALDVTTQAQVLELLNRLVSERGAAVLLITHNLGIVAEFCDTVRVMYAGRLVEGADTRSLFRAPAHPYSDALLRAVPRADRLQRGPLPAIEGAPPNLAELPPGCAFEPRCPLGSGRPECRGEAPANRPVADGRVAECHHAEEQLAQEKVAV
ncbi:peptide/nickel transport system ATP-binding protein [Solirubrobacter pauli]|uniref:Peptide/nickel transport system ATP-binding protein n=1 Tax=Solirubrobacter pauli TaxID=166793 RepID=A0A660LCR2_9ACTN|nr:ABC transporter ATP-binding protein [Solirubrobacter pauli]RKQ92837.1 peptide/nickel transport system ATP-binding protein [Solirubrobacter pauli]